MSPKDIDANPLCSTTAIYYFAFKELNSFFVHIDAIEIRVDLNFGF